MYKQLTGFLFFVILVCACAQQNQKDIKVEEKNLNQEKVHFSNKESILKQYTSSVEDWKEYGRFRDFLKDHYQNTTITAAKNNSKELLTLSEELKDSIIPKKIDLKSFEARLNLLHSESLRLYDMSLISSIKDQEVIHQIQKIFDAFSSVNAKVNSILIQLELEEKYRFDLDVSVKKLERDTTAIIPKSISKKYKTQ